MFWPFPIAKTKWVLPLSQWDLTNLRTGITYSPTLLKLNNLNVHSFPVLMIMCKYWPCFRYPNNFKMTWKDFQHLVKLLLLVSALQYYRFLIHSKFDLKSTASSKFYILFWSNLHYILMNLHIWNFWFVWPLFLAKSTKFSKFFKSVLERKLHHASEVGCPSCGGTVSRSSGYQYFKQLKISYPNR